MVSLTDGFQYCGRDNQSLCLIGVSPLSSFVNSLVLLSSYLTYPTTQQNMSMSFVPIPPHLLYKLIPKWRNYWNHYYLNCSEGIFPYLPLLPDKYIIPIIVVMGSISLVEVFPPVLRRYWFLYLWDYCTESGYDINIIFFKMSSLMFYRVCFYVDNLRI